MVLWMALLGCIDTVSQVGGTGSTYTTKCTAEMEVSGVIYTAACTPPTCMPGYTSAAVSHAGVALDPGRKLIGVAERACVQDLSTAAALFQPPDGEQMDVGKEAK
ncbi:MAG: hypothetical protein R3F61_26615 [Myxococcota bacterium]